MEVFEIKNEILKILASPLRILVKPLKLFPHLIFSVGRDSVY